MFVFSELSLQYAKNWPVKRVPSKKFITKCNMKSSWISALRLTMALSIAFHWLDEVRLGILQLERFSSATLAKNCSKWEFPILSNKNTDLGSYSLEFCVSVEWISAWKPISFKKIIQWSCGWLKWLASHKKGKTSLCLPKTERLIFSAVIAGSLRTFEAWSWNGSMLTPGCDDGGHLHPGLWARLEPPDAFWDSVHLTTMQNKVCIVVDWQNCASGQT